MALMTIWYVKDKRKESNAVTINTNDITKLTEVEETEWANVCGWADFSGPGKVKCTNINMNNGNLYQVRGTKSETEDKIKKAETNAEAGIGIHN